MTDCKYPHCIGAQGGTVCRVDCRLPDPPKRLTDSEIGEIWFQARLPGVTETAARVLIRAAEAHIYRSKA